MNWKLYLFIYYVICLGLTTSVHISCEGLLDSKYKWIRRLLILLLCWYETPTRIIRGYLLSIKHDQVLLYNLRMYELLQQRIEDGKKRTEDDKV